jgi:integrase
MEAARQRGRYGHRDATMILIAYRHGLRASELCALRWDQIDFSRGLLHVQRVKNGTPSVHPIGGIEIRALRRLKREQLESRTNDDGRRPKDDGACRGAGEISVSDSPTHVAACLWVQARQRWARHPRVTALPRSPEHTAHGALHRVITGALQELLGGLKQLSLEQVFDEVIPTGELQLSFANMRVAGPKYPVP